AVEEAAVAHDRERRLPEGDTGAERSRPRVAERPRSERVEEPARAENREMRPGPVGEDGHVPSGCRLSGQRVSNRCEEAALELAALLVEPGGDSLADGASPFLRAAVRLPLGQALDKSRKRRARVADETERGEGGADAFLVGIDLDELPAEPEPVLLGRLGTELRADDEHHVGFLDEVAESGFVAGRAGGELVILGEG